MKKEINVVCGKVKIPKDMTDKQLDAAMKRFAKKMGVKLVKVK